MSLVIDPGIVMVPNDHQVFILHPGESKRFNRDFAELNAVFLDFPGADVGTPIDGEFKDLWARLKMARAIASWHRNDRPNDKRPSKDVKDYSENTDKNERPRYLHEFTTLFLDAKKGDMVLVPGPGYVSNVLIGEFVSDYDAQNTVEVGRYPFEKIPARPVVWRRVDIRKVDFSPRLIKLMQNRSALIRVTAPNDLREVYSVAYGNYIWKETSGNLLRVRKDHVDLHELSLAINLVNYFSAQYVALKRGQLETFLKLDPEDALEQFYDKSLFGEVDIEIHSPGIIGRVMKAAALAAYVSSMVAMSAAEVSAAEAATAKVENSASKIPTACDLELEKDIRETMEIYANYDRWEKKNCKRSVRAKLEVGLEPDVKLRRGQAEKD